MWLRNRISKAFVSVTQLEGFLSALFILVIFKNQSSLHSIYTESLNGWTLHKKKHRFSVPCTLYLTFQWVQPLQCLGGFRFRWSVKLYHIGLPILGSFLVRNETNRTRNMESVSNAYRLVGLKCYWKVFKFVVLFGGVYRLWLIFVFFSFFSDCFRDFISFNFLEIFNFSIS